MRRLSRVVTSVTSVVSLAVLAGCGGGPPEAGPAPTPSPTAASTGPSPSPPVAPAAASDNTRRGAGAFVEHYIDILNYATRTGDVGAAKSLSSPQCISCNRMLSSVASVYQSNGSVDGGLWKPKLVSAVASADGWVVDVRLRFDPQVIVRTEGGTAERYEGGTGLASFTVERKAGGWRVAQWTRAT